MNINFDSFIQNPECLWDLNTTKRLVELKWSALITTSQFKAPNEYSTASILSNTKNLKIERYDLGLNSGLETYLESYSEDYCQNFYLDNGLIPEDNSELSSISEKIVAALALFNFLGGPIKSINLLVRSIHVVKQDNPEIDISHSDPNIPFSIFVSVCKDFSPISNLRVAESILHEAMHLKLTILESIVPLVKYDTKKVFFSPWRNEERPVRGVLHGLFVFRSIFDFYNVLESKTNKVDIRVYLESRKKQIISEFKQLKNFHDSVGLTQNGANLARNLLPLN